MNDIRETKGIPSAAMSKRADLHRIISAAASKTPAGQVLVGFSGGADSSLLLWEAVQVLSPENVIAVTATSPTSIPGEEQEARAFAARLGARHFVIPTAECSDVEFLANSPDRCYRCKLIRYEMLTDLAASFGSIVVFDGSQADDDPEDRPGMRALQELGIATPLADAGLGKKDVRALLRAAGLTELAEKKAQPCLATRIPTDTLITLDALDMIAKGESFLKSQGLATIRLRHHFPLARLVTDEAGMALIVGNAELRTVIHGALKQLGYAFVTLDLAPYPEVG